MKNNMAAGATTAAVAASTVATTLRQTESYYNEMIPLWVTIIIIIQLAIVVYGLYTLLKPNKKNPYGTKS